MEGHNKLNQQILIGIPLSDFDDRIGTIVEAAVKRVIAEKEPLKYFSIQEASKYTGKAISTLYTDHSRGRLKAFKSGRHLRFTEQQLRDYLEGR